jgi:hypothetical protein
LLLELDATGDAASDDDATGDAAGDDDAIGDVTSDEEATETDVAVVEPEFEL